MAFVGAWSAAPIMSAPSRSLADFHAFRVSTALPCKGCRYDLRGLHADGRCPECGLEVIESIAQRVDPELAFLPPLPHARIAGSSLLIVTCAMATATVVTTLSAASIWLARLPPDVWRDALAQWLPPTLSLQLAAIPPAAIGVATLAALGLVRWGGYRSARRYLLLFGLGAWLIASSLPPEELPLALSGAAAMISLIGLGPIVTSLGKRSRTYRLTTRAQQTIGPLTSAIAVAVLSLLVARWLDPIPNFVSSATLRLIATVSLGMAVVGFLYLVLNGFWIWKALWWWQPLLERVLDRTDGASTQPDPET